MRTKIEKIGGGFGLIVPKELLDACGFRTEATVSVENHTLVVAPIPRPVRAGWAEAARKMREHGDDLTPELQEWDEVADDWEATECQRPVADADEKV